MKKTLLSLLFVALTISTSSAQSRFVGGDISLIPSYEVAGDVYLSYDGTKIDDLVVYLHEICGWNAGRVRLFVEPTGRNNSNGDTDNAVCQDLDYVARLGKRIKDAGMSFMLDFHYTDTWADPTYQGIPSRWPNNNDEVLADSLYQYTKDCLNALIAYGAKPDFVQIGNEISYGMLWRNSSDKVYPGQDKSARAAQWERLTKLLQKASQAVRETCSEAKIIVHTERSGKASETANFYDCISSVDYDIIGLSYYPFWHGNLASLGSTLDKLAATQPDKSIQIVETAYNFQYSPDNVTYDFSKEWPYTPAGQYKFVNDLIDALKDRSQVNGLYYWFPEECGNGFKQEVLGGWLNRGLWVDGWQVEQHLPVTITQGRNDGALYIMRNFLDGNTQSLGTIQSDLFGKTLKYNISGQVISQPAKGELFIQNGKKIIQK